MFEDGKGRSISPHWKRDAMLLKMAKELSSMVAIVASLLEMLAHGLRRRGINYLIADSVLIHFRKDSWLLIRREGECCIVWRFN